MRGRGISFGVVALVLLTLAASGCGSESDGGGGDGGDGSEPAASVSAEVLEGRVFVSQEVTGRDLVEGSSITLSFQDGQMSANAGCNQMTGTFEVDGTTLRWTGTPAATMMACDEPLMAQDDWLGGLLTNGVEAELDGSDLTLTADEVTIALLDDEVASPAQPLVGTAWTLDTIIEGDTASSVSIDLEPPTLQIAEDGTASVFAGCNRGSGTVEVAEDGSTATFGPIALTKMLCPEGGSDLEAVVVSVLDGEVEVAIEGDRLTLTKVDRALGYVAG